MAPLRFDVEGANAGRAFARDQGLAGVDLLLLLSLSSTSVGKLLLFLKTDLGVLPN